MEPHRHRASVKQGSSSSWREKIREDCWRRARERRQQTLQQHRQSLSPLSAAQLQRDVHAAVQEVLSGLQPGGSPAGPGGGGAPSGGAAGADAAAAACAAAGAALPQPPPADVDAFLAEIEQQIVAEMLRELEQVEEFEAAALAAAVAEREALVAAAAGVSPTSPGPHSPFPHQQHQQPQQQQYHHHHYPQQQQEQQQQQQQHQQHQQGGAHPDPPQLLCPVCMAAFLMQRAGVVACPRGCLQLNLAAESLSLEDVRARLKQAYEDHRATGCGGSLAFRVEDAFGTKALASRCGVCQHWGVIV